MTTQTIPFPYSRLEVDSLRGLALIAVVWHHASLVMGNQLVKLELYNDQVRQIVTGLSALIAPLRMPLFTILSGLVYAMKPVADWRIGQFVQGKVRRIMIPLFFVSTLKYFQILFLDGQLPTLKYLGESFSVPVNEFWVTWFYHFGHLWFLQALLLIFLVVMLIEAAGLMRTFRSWLIWLMISFTLPYVLSGSSLWSTHNALRLSVFFVFGIGLLRFHEQILSPRNLIPMLIAFLTAMAIYILWKKNFF